MKIKQWDIVIFSLLDEGGIQTHWLVDIEGKPAYKIDIEEAEDCLAVMGMIGDDISDFGFPNDGDVRKLVSH